MKIREIHIEHFRSLDDITIHPKDILALIGRNNSGKSNVIKALELFFVASTKLVDDECFCNLITDTPIGVFLTFEDLSDWEKEQFGPWMIDDNRLIIGRQIICHGKDSLEINNIAVKSVPSHEWLREDLISGERINEWWDSREDLRTNGLDFGRMLGTSKPTVGRWKELAADFISEHREELSWERVLIDNPKGYPGVLKGALPEFIYVPAIRDITDETKILKTNPFGQLINYVIEKVSEEQKATISEQLKQIEQLLNRSGEGERIKEIDEIELRLNRLMSEVMDCDIEIEISMPELREVLGGAKIFADDGIRTAIETKGHGMQRSMIFTILRAYAELTYGEIAGDDEIGRSTIFAIEEPELYLHPQSQRTFLAVIRNISSGRDQVIYSTHSNLLVDVCYFDEICILRREKKDEGYISYPTQLSLENIIEDLRRRKGIEATEEGIRAQYYNAFNQLVNEGFFADKVVIVEGPSEQYSLPIYSESLGYNLDRNNVSVVHVDGKGQMDRIFRILVGLGISVYLWFDGDKESQDVENRRKTLELLELAGDPIDNIEGVQTKITGSYAVLEFDYERLLKSEIEQYEALVQEAAEEIGPTGKPLKHRYIANKLKERVENGEDPKGIIPPTIVDIVNSIMSLT